MISETVLIWLATIALLVDYVAVAKANDRLSASISFVISLLFWLAYTMNALNYMTYSGGEGFQNSAQGLALIGLVASVTTLVLLVATAFGGVTDAFENQE